VKTILNIIAKCRARLIIEIIEMEDKQIFELAMYGKEMDKTYLYQVREISIEINKLKLNILNVILEILT
jgi:hypothetical protein